MKNKQIYKKPGIKVKKIHFNVLFTNFNDNSLLALVGPGQLCCGNPELYCPSSCSGGCSVCPQDGYCAC